MGRRSWTREDLEREVAAVRANAEEPILYVAFTPEALGGMLDLALADGATVQITGAEEIPPGGLALYKPLALISLRVVTPDPRPAVDDR